MPFCTEGERSTRRASTEAKSAAGFTATAGRAGDTNMPSATPRISPPLAFMPTKAANAMTKMGIMILNICCLHSEMPKRITPFRRQANHLFSKRRIDTRRPIPPKAAGEGSAGQVSPRRGAIPYLEVELCCREPRRAPQPALKEGCGTKEPPRPSERPSPPVPTTSRPVPRGTRRGGGRRNPHR